MPDANSELDTPRGLSRRRFAGLGALTLGGVAAGLATGCSSSTPASTPPSAGQSGNTRKVGFVLSHEQFSTAQLVDFAAAAESAGFGYVWASDHLQPWQDNEGHADFPWITLGLVSQRTRTTAFGTGVTCPTYRHHPSEVAQAFATLTNLAPGRTFLGVGTGEAVNEQAGTGQFGRYPERHDRLVEAITLIRQLWSGQRTSFVGRYYRTDQLKLYDLPGAPPPIYVAASGPKSAALAGQYGDGWITGNVDPTLRTAFEQAARAAKKDPAHLPIFVEKFVVVGDDTAIAYAAQRWQFLGGPGQTYQPSPVAVQQLAQNIPRNQVTRNWLISTDPRAHIDAVQQLLNAGITPFIHAAQPDPRKVIDFYGGQVLSRLH